MPPDPDPAAARRALTVISLGVFLATSTWFSGTAAARELASLWTLDAHASARLTSATQWGFIVGTLLYALTNLADRFDARRVFCLSALIGAAANLGFAWASSGLGAALAFRFATGVALAGVYPVGMKLIASWYQSGPPLGRAAGEGAAANAAEPGEGRARDSLGWRLGVMVGCLTLGTAFPYGIAALELALDWRYLASTASIAATLGGLLVLLGCDEGPYLRSRARLDLRMIGRVFRHQPFRATAFGYFGHMWELYALWSLAGFWLDARFEGSDRIATIAFATVAIGALGCVLGGLISRRIGERKVAMFALIGSGACCVLSGFAFSLPAPLLLAFLLIWGVLVVADSPQFSALAARHAPAEYTGTALTIQNGIGFTITIGSIQLLPYLAGYIGWRWVFAALAIGPLLGAIATVRVPEPRSAR